MAKDKEKQPLEEQEQEQNTPETEPQQEEQQEVTIDMNAILEGLKAQAEAAEKKAEETKETLLRTAAEYDNFRKRKKGVSFKGHRVRRHGYGGYKSVGGYIFDEFRTYKK